MSLVAAHNELSLASGVNIQGTLAGSFIMNGGIGLTVSGTKSVLY